MIDAHLHVWDLSVSTYAWLGPATACCTRRTGPSGRLQP